MADSTLAYVIGLLAGSIFFIDGWGPSQEGVSFLESRRFRGLSIIISGGIISPVLDYVTQNQKHEFVLGYLRGCVWGWLFVFLLGLVIYLFWKLTKGEKDKKGFWYKAGEFAYSILDFIYLGISDNPHLKAKRDNDVKLAKEIYELESGYEVKQKKKELEELDTFGQEIYKVQSELRKQDYNPNQIIAATKDKLNKYDQQLKSIKTEADYTFDDWYYKGLAEYDKKEYEKAIVYLKNALEKNIKGDSAADAYLYIGLSYDYLGLYQKGIEQYEKTFNDEFKGYKNLHMAYNNKGADLIDLGNYAEAIRMLDEAIKLKPDFADAWYNKGLGLSKLFRNEDAIQAYDEAIKRRPDYSDAWYNKGISLGDLERHEEAIQAYEEAIKFKPDYTDAWNNKGLGLAKLGRYKEAIQAYDEAIKLSPDNADAWNNKGVSFSDLDRDEEAIQAYKEAIKLRPDYADAWYNMACSFSLQNNKDKMLDNLKKSIELTPELRDSAKIDEDFKNFRNDPDFKKLVQ